MQLNRVQRKSRRLLQGSQTSGGNEGIKEQEHTEVLQLWKRREQADAAGQRAVARAPSSVRLLLAKTCSTDRLRAGA